MLCWRKERWEAGGLSYCLLFLDDAVRMKLCLPTRQTWWFVQGTWCFCSGHVFRLQLTKVFLLKSFYQKTSYGRPKGNCFLCQLGVGDLKLMLYVNDVDIGCCRMYVSFCSIEYSWHMQNWSGKRLSCSAPAMIICHWGWKAFALEGLPLFVILRKPWEKRGKNVKGRIAVRGDERPAKERDLVTSR